MMHKLLLGILILIIFLIPKSEVFALPQHCDLEPPLNKTTTLVSIVLIGPLCPPNTCYKFTATPGAFCFLLKGATSSAPPGKVCDPTKGECTSGGGKRCNPASNTDTSEGTGIKTAIGCVPTEPKALVEGLLKYGTFAAGGIAFLIMIFAALQMITAEGNPEAIKGAQEKFYSAIIGLLLIIFSVLLMQVIGVDILGLPGFKDPLPRNEIT